MVKQLVDTTTNNGTHIGDPAKTAFEKVNANFNELYPAALPGTEAERAAARGRMGLGTAAEANTTLDYYDSTPGRVLRVGSGGLLGVAIGGTEADDLGRKVSGFYSAYAPVGYQDEVLLIALQHGNPDFAGRLALSINDSSLSIRNKIAGVWRDPIEMWSSKKSSALPITGSLSPATDNSVSYGTAARRPTQLFAATATIGTSDAREKTPVRTLTEAEYAVGLQLAREIGAYRWLEAVERKGPAAREHFGQTVQRAIEIFQQHGLDPFGYGAICYDTWEQETVEHPAQYEQIEIPAVLDEEGNEIESARYEQGKLTRDAWTEVTLKAGDRYSWRDSELFWMICAAQQRQADELAQQQAGILARLEALEQGA